MTGSILGLSIYWLFKVSPHLSVTAIFQMLFLYYIENKKTFITLINYKNILATK